MMPAMETNQHERLALDYVRDHPGITDIKLERALRIGTLTYVRTMKRLTLDGFINSEYRNRSLCYSINPLAMIPDTGYNNLDVVARMAINGWHVLPAEPGEKQTYCKWSLVTPQNYNFAGLFAGAPMDTNAAILTDGQVAVVDLDAHGAEPNGATLFRHLDPKIYRGAIVEKTPSGGVHIYYRAPADVSYYTATATVFGSPVKVEILAGRRLSYCWPSVTEKGKYQITSRESFLNTAPWELPPLPEYWTSLPRASVSMASPTILSPIRRRARDDLSDEDMRAALEYFMNEARFGGDGRHEQARALARCLAGIEIHAAEIERCVAEYIRSHGRDLTDKLEARRLAEYGITHPLEATPWRAIMASRRKRERQRISRLVGVPSCPAT